MNPHPLAFGHVVGRYVLGVGDTADDGTPIETPAAGEVRFVMVTPASVFDGEPAVTAIAESVTVTLDDTGMIRDRSDNAGVWLVVGQYSVTCDFEGMTLGPFRVQVTAEHTAEHPLDLSLAAPLVPSPAVKFVVNEQVYLDTLAAKDAADDARDASEVAAGAADAAATTALQAAGDAVTARTGAETARAGAEDARTDAEAARDLALAGQFAGASLGGNADLDAITTPGVYYQNTSSAATPDKHYPVTTAGVLEVFYSSAVWRVQRYATGGGGTGATPVVYVRKGTLSGGVWTWAPWALIARLRVDQTAGRAFYAWDDVNNREQLIYGDTGWRNIVTHLRTPTPDTATIVGGAFQVRRMGQSVELLFENLSSSASSTWRFDLPAGFRPGREAGAAIYGHGTVDATPRRVTVRWDGLNGTVALQTTGGSGRINYATTDPWPGELPGTPQGSIPNA
jgi:hypothetical protein